MNGGLGLKSHFPPRDGVFPLHPRSGLVSCPYSLGLPMIFSIVVCMPFVPCQGEEAEAGPLKTRAFRGSDSSQDCSAEFSQYVPYNVGSLAYAVKICMPLRPLLDKFSMKPFLFYTVQNHCSFLAATFVCKWLRKTGVGKWLLILMFCTLQKYRLWQHLIAQVLASVIT